MSFLSVSYTHLEHAKMWYKLLNGGAVGSTIENLKAAAEGENYEWTDMYDPVSYTHLIGTWKNANAEEVFTFQENDKKTYNVMRWFYMLKKGLCLLIGIMMLFCQINVVPVSYTHLDVYKRQQ